MKQIDQFIKLLVERLPHCEVKLDEPQHAGGNYWIDVRNGTKLHTLEYRPEFGFGVFHDDAAYGEGPAEIYRTPERAAKRVEQLFKSDTAKPVSLRLKEIRELYGQSQVAIAKKAGIKQPAVCRFESRGEIKLSTLSAMIEAMGGNVEIRAHFKDADLPILISTKG